MSYVYTYVNIETGKTYFGSRKCNISADKDFNIRYFSSSRDQQFREDMINNLLIGHVLVELEDLDACRRIEHMLINDFWKSFGNELSYNHYCNGKFYNTKPNKSSFKKGMGAWNKGIPMRDDTKIKLSKVLKGKTSWIKGKHHSDESKQKMSTAHKGKISPRKDVVLSEDTKEKIRLHHSGGTKTHKKIYIKNMLTQEIKYLPVNIAGKYIKNNWIKI